MRNASHLLPHGHRVEIYFYSVMWLPWLPQRGLKRKKYDMPQFEFDALDEKEVIGRGSYGIVHKARYLNEEVVNVSHPLQQSQRSFTFVIARKLGFGAANGTLFYL